MKDRSLQHMLTDCEECRASLLPPLTTLETLLTDVTSLESFSKEPHYNFLPPRLFKAKLPSMAIHYCLQCNDIVLKNYPSVAN